MNISITAASRSHLQSILALVLVIASCLLVSAQQDRQEETVEFREPFDHIDLFDGAIEVGKTYTKLYLGGDGIAGLKIKAFDDSKSSIPVEWSETDQRYTLDYLKEPIIDLEFGGKPVRLVVRLIQVDWPGNEINWRMIPEVTIISTK